MNTIYLEPSDILFFRDGRPMGGSMAGHGTAWPLPSVISAAFHASLHRARLENVHQHRRGARGEYANEAQRDRRFGSLLTAGPFPVNPDGRWYFPRPADLLDDSLEPALLPSASVDWKDTSSLPAALSYATLYRLPHTKEIQAKDWLARDAFDKYLGGTGSVEQKNASINAEAFADTEHAYGIAIDPQTGLAGSGSASGMFYSAHYLRLRDRWRLGVCAEAIDKTFSRHDGDLVRALIRDASGKIIVGGQQRVCRAELSHHQVLPLPRGKTSGFREANGKYLVKWVLLSPAVWPEMPQGVPADSENIPCTGGWLPNWIHPTSREVLLRSRSGNIRRDYSGPKARRVAEKESAINARLVAAIVPKPIVVTGWSVPDENSEKDTERREGPRQTHLAVPAGAVYYFEAKSATDASNLAASLNWHDDNNPLRIKNRRSTLFGEKGFGLGVCAEWNFFENAAKPA